MESIFSTYSTGENRVTASLLAVLRSLSLDRIQRLVGALLEQSEFELVRFENQPSKGGEGVPDAIIHASVRLLVETKIARNAVNAAQVDRHLKRLNEATEATKLLLVITSDDKRPDIFDSFGDKPVIWTSFRALDQAIDELLDDIEEVTSEREAFLLRELQKMLAAEGFLPNVDEIVVVAARNAWPEYNKISAYVCQPNRHFQQVSRMAFYSEGKLHPLVPKILSRHDSVAMIPGQESGPLGELVRLLVEKKWRNAGECYMVFLLSPPDSPDTLVLPRPIPNDLKSESGKPTAFTMGQRYVALDRLKKARTTSELVSTKSPA